MAEYPSLPIFTDAYLGDTTHLTLEEHGAYLKLLMIAWRSPDCDLPNDPKRLSVMLGVGLKKFASIWATVGLFWDEIDGRLTQKKLLKVRSRVNHMVEQKRAAGIASAEAKRLKNSDSAPTDVLTETPAERQRGGQQPKPNLTETSTVPSERAPDEPAPPAASPDLKAEVFGKGLAWLAEKSGKPEAKLRPLVGKWCRDHGDGRVFEVLCGAARASPVDPIPWITQALTNEQRQADATDIALRLLETA